MATPKLRDRRAVIEQFDCIAPSYDLLPIAAADAASLFTRRRPEGCERALDLGCGTGRTILALSGYFRHVIGVDISRGMLQRAAIRIEPPGNQNIQIALMDAEVLGFRDNSFDYIVTHTTLHHELCLLATMEEIARVLKPGGRTVIVDIVRELISGAWPVGATKLHALLWMIREVFRGRGEGSLHSYRAMTGRPWLDHQRRERFIRQSTLLAASSRALPGARMVLRKGEMGMTRFAEIVWDKPK